LRQAVPDPEAPFIETTQMDRPRKVTEELVPDVCAHRPDFDGKLGLQTYRGRQGPDSTPVSSYKVIICSYRPANCPRMQFAGRDQEAKEPDAPLTVPIWTEQTATIKMSNTDRSKYHSRPFRLDRVRRRRNSRPISAALDRRNLGHLFMSHHHHFTMLGAFGALSIN
jgi:hypothetical protein